MVGCVALGAVCGSCSRSQLSQPLAVVVVVALFPLCGQSCTNAPVCGDWLFGYISCWRFPSECVAARLSVGEQLLCEAGGALGLLLAQAIHS